MTIGSQQFQAINTTQTQVFALAAGWHAVLIDHVQITGGVQLGLQWQVPGTTTFSAIPASSLARRAITSGVDGYQPRAAFLGGMFPRTSAGKNGAPALLSATTAFADLAALRVGPGIVPYTVNNPLWSDGANKQRWVAIPEAEKATFNAHDAWDFPIGTVFIKHFSLPRDNANPTGEQIRVETRFLIYGDDDQPYGITYRWRPDQSDADLMTDITPDSPLVVTYSTGAKRTWNIPNQEQCMSCHRGKIGDNGVKYFALGVLTHQLNREYQYPSGRSLNQLQAWSELGLLDNSYDRTQVSSYPASVSLDAPLDAAKGVTNELKVRSYLSSNCAMCHFGGTNVECPTLDARFTRVSDVGNSAQRVQALINQPTQDGVDVLIRPKQPDMSMVLMRMNRSGVWTTLQMPPLGRTLVDTKAVGVMRSWISELIPQPAGFNVKAVDIALPVAKSPLLAQDGFTYLSDTGLTWLTNPVQSTTRNIANVTSGTGDAGIGDPALYSSYRIGPMNWAFPVNPGSTYRISVLMSDEFFATPKSRLFSINLEGSSWVSQLDLVDKTAGKSKAYLLTRTITAADAILNLDFVRGTKDNPTAAAIRIEEVLPMPLRMPTGIGMREPDHVSPWQEGQALAGLWMPLIPQAGSSHGAYHGE